MGAECAKRLLQEIHSGGACDSSAQMLVALCMTLGQTDLSTFVMGPLTNYTSVELYINAHRILDVSALKHCVICTIS